MLCSHMYIHIMSKAQIPSNCWMLPHLATGEPTTMTLGGVYSDRHAPTLQCRLHLTVDIYAIGSLEWIAPKSQHE